MSGVGYTSQKHFQTIEIQYHNCPHLAKSMTEQGFIELEWKETSPDEMKHRSNEATTSYAETTYDASFRNKRSTERN